MKVCTSVGCKIQKVLSGRAPEVSLVTLAVTHLSRNEAIKEAAHTIITLGIRASYLASIGSTSKWMMSMDNY